MVQERSGRIVDDVPESLVLHDNHHYIVERMIRLIV